MVKLAPQAMQEVIRGLQALRGVAHISAVTIAAELGNISSRFECTEADGLLRSISERRLQWHAHSKRQHYQVRQRAHLRRIVVESAWSYRHLPRVGEKLRKRQKGFRQRSPKLHGRRRTACTSVT